MKRRSLTPRGGIPAFNGMHATRRAGVRHEVSERVTLRRDTGETLRGWALNISRGGVRVIFEGKLCLGEELDVAVGDVEPQIATRGRVVWIQEEADGAIVGVEFTRFSGMHRATGALPTAADSVPDSEAAVSSSNPGSLDR